MTGRRGKGEDNRYSPALLTRRGVPGYIQREIYKAVLPVLKKYEERDKRNINDDRFLGLAIDALTEAFKTVLRGGE